MITLGNGAIIFHDGTTMSSANIAYPNIVGHKTALSQYTNNLGNYGPFFTSSSVSPNPTTNWGNPVIQLGYISSNNTMTVTATNCNCVCNC